MSLPCPCPCPCPCPRGPTALLVVVALLACDDAPPPQPSGGRVVAVAAEQPAGDPDDFCDAQPNTDYAAPELATTIASSSGWRWINVWATWCAPCVEEIPLLKEMTAELASDGRPVALELISADADEETVTRFRGEHEGVPDSSRIADPTTLPSWLAARGLDEGAPLPVHLLVDPAGKVRCARSGAVREDDLAAIRAVVAR